MDAHEKDIKLFTDMHSLDNLNVIFGINNIKILIEISNIIP